jgi:transposase
MRNAIPPIPEAVATLQERLRHEHDGHQKPRGQMLDRLARRQAPTRQDAARLLGVHRHTIGRWLARDAAGGMDALLATDVPAGQPVSRAPAGLARLAQALRQPEGCASDEALRQWGHQTQGVEVKDQTLDTIVRTRFRPKLTGPRPSHTKTPWRDSRLPGQRS